MAKVKNVHAHEYYAEYSQLSIQCANNMLLVKDPAILKCVTYTVRGRFHVLFACSTQ